MSDADPFIPQPDSPLGYQAPHTSPRRASAYRWARVGAIVACICGMGSLLTLLADIAGLIFLSPLMATAASLFSCLTIMVTEGFLFARLWLYSILRLAGRRHRDSHGADDTGHAGRTDNLRRLLMVHVRLAAALLPLALALLLIVVQLAAVLNAAHAYTSQGWELHTDDDGSRWWAETHRGNSCRLHRESSDGRIDSRDVYSPLCEPPLREKEILQYQDKNDDEPSHEATTIAPTDDTSSTPDISATDSDTDTGTSENFIDDAAVMVTDPSGMYGLTGRGILAVVKEGNTWRQQGYLPTSGQPTFLSCVTPRCVAGIGTANGGEVWGTVDEGVTWRKIDLPATLSPEQSFVTYAVPDPQDPAQWQVCVNYPEWVISDDAPTCVVITLSTD